MIQKLAEAPSGTAAGPTAPTLLDTLAIFFFSSFLLLLLLWIASTLVGAPLVTNVPAYLSQPLTSIWAWISSGAAGTAALVIRYLTDRKSVSPNYPKLIAKYLFVEMGALALLVILVSVVTILHPRQKQLDVKDASKGGDQFAAPLGGGAQTANSANSKAASSGGRGAKNLPESKPVSAQADTGQKESTTEGVFSLAEPGSTQQWAINYKVLGRYSLTGRHLKIEITGGSAKMAPAVASSASLEIVYLQLGMCGPDGNGYTPISPRARTPQDTVSLNATPVEKGVEYQFPKTSLAMELDRTVDPQNAWVCSFLWTQSGLLPANDEPIRTEVLGRTPFKPVAAPFNPNPSPH